MSRKGEKDLVFGQVAQISELDVWRMGSAQQTLGAESQTFRGLICDKSRLRFWLRKEQENVCEAALRTLLPALARGNFPRGIETSIHKRF